MATVKYINVYTGAEREVSPLGGDPYAYPVGYFDGPCPFDLLTAAKQRQHAQWLADTLRSSRTLNPSNSLIRARWAQAQRQLDALLALPAADDHLLTLAQQAGGQLWADEVLVRDVVRWTAYQTRLQEREAYRRERQAAYTRWQTGYWQALREGQVDVYVNATL